MYICGAREGVSAMKKALSVLLAVLLACMFAGCETRQDKLYKRAVLELQEQARVNAALYGDLSYAASVRPKGDTRPTPVPGDSLRGTLHIKSLDQRGDMPSIYWLAREFMDMHPMAHIEIEYGGKFREKLTKAEREIRSQAFFDRIRIEMVAGSADYLLYGAAGGMDYVPMSGTGLLVDMKKYWGQDPDIRDEDYFTEILEAFQVDGRQTVLPMGFHVSGVYLNRQALEEIGADPDSMVAVDPYQLLDWYGQVRDLHPDMQLFFSAQGRDALFPIEATRYIDLENREAHFDSPEFIDFLTRTGSVINDDPLLDPQWERGWGNGLLLNAALLYQDTGKIAGSVAHFADSGFPEEQNIVVNGRPSLAVEGTLSLFELVEAQQHMLEYTAGPLLLESSQGRLGVTSSIESFAMPASLQNKELAWEFIKYCMAERENLGFSSSYGYTGQHYYMHDAMPVNKANFYKMAQKVPQDVTGVFGGTAIELLRPQEVDLDAMAWYMGQVLARDPVDLGKYAIDLQEDLDKYYVNELITPQMCAEKLQARTEIWLYE